MRKYVLLGFAFALVGQLLIADETAQDIAEASGKQLRHVVLFQFKEAATESQIKEVANSFAALPQQIEEIVDFEWGVNNSPEGLNDGLSHCFFVSFANKEGRAKYLPHPAHKAFVAKLKPILEKAVVVDYWPK